VTPATLASPEPREDLPSLQRGHGAAEVGFARRGAATTLAHLYQRAPCRVLTPLSEAGDPPQAVLLTTSGGLADGDTIDLALGVGPGASATFTTQAAEKVYRARGTEPARLRARIEVAADGWLEWLPQECILFDGARFDRRTLAEVAPGGRLLACEMVVFGRRASGERFTRGFLHDGWDIRRGGTLVWRDALRLDGGIAEALASPAGFAGAEAMASVLYVAEDAAGQLAVARRLIEDGAPIGDGAARAGATLVNGVLLARWLGGATAVRAGLTQYLARFRAAAAGLPARLPRVWQC
jgi:urease accessory protein